jgi:predicted DNA-binding transcriptional regulator AlpA
MKSAKKLKTAEVNGDFQDAKPITWLRSKEVREKLGISTATLQIMKEKALIPSYKLGNMYFFNEEEINNVILESKMIKKEMI